MELAVFLRMASREKIILETVSTSKKVAFLKDPKSYPEEPPLVTVIETHMSLLFLTPSFVFKLKKPVKFDSIDFSTLEARYDNCLEELRLNKELADSIYLEVLPLSLDSSGKLNWEGRGKPVDWLVKMKRLEEKNLLNHVLLNKKIDEARLKKAAKKLSVFYQSREPVKFELEDFLFRLEKKMKANLTELQDPAYNLSKDYLNRIFEQQIDFLRKHSGLFHKRIRTGKIVEAHGDLKPEHICLDEDPVIIDRLEFNKDLRVLDVAEELSFLAIECELLDSPQTGEVFFKTYEEVTGDRIPLQLKNFYKSKQSFLRAKFAIWHIREARYQEEQKWRTRTDQCLRLSKQYADLLL